MEGGDISKTVRHSQHFQALGYEVLLFADADVDGKNVDLQSLSNSGVKVVVWSDGLNTEKRVCQDLPVEILIQVVEAVVDNDATFLPTMGIKGFDLEQMKAKLRDSKTASGIRARVAQCLINKSTFKRIDHGEELGRLISATLETIPDTDLYQKLHKIKNWIYSQ